jgi:exopolysaccharide biosynthesis polyprenyl glycosylphosphotransferase
MKPSADRSARQGDFLIPFLTVMFDAAAIEFAFLFSYWLRFRSVLAHYLGMKEVGGPPFEGYLFGSFVITVIWLLLFQARKMYSTRRNVTLADEFINVVKVATLGMLIVMSAAFFYRDFSYSRVVFGLLWVSSIVFITAGRAAVQTIERRFYRKGKHLRQCIIIGNESLANQVYTQLHRHPSFGFNIVGYFADAPAQEPLALAQARYCGPIENAPEFIRRHGIDLVFLALRSKEQHQLFELISDCEGLNVEFMMVPDVLDVLTSNMTLKELEGIPFLAIKTIPLTVWGRISKRAFDIVVSATLLIVLAPLWLLIMALVKLTSPGPIFFKQKRVGMDGKEFTMYKFRSMYVDAEQQTGPVWTARNDPRRTPLGVFLRKTSLDELPQLFNVLRGDMSLVGPRPERQYFVEQFKHLVPKYLDRHRVKAGVTGWAQVNGLRGNTSLEERIKYDLYYIENWSFTFDIKILLRTLRAVFSFKQVD